MQCFYCHLLGHVKSTCYKRKIEFVYQWLMEIATKIQFIQMNVEKLIKESKIIVKGQVSKLICKHQEVGEYTGPGLPTPIRLLLKLPYDVKLTEVVLRKPVQRETQSANRLFKLMPLWKNRPNITKEFNRHISLEHDGYALPNNILNSHLGLTGWISTLTKWKYFQVSTLPQKL